MDLEPNRTKSRIQAMNEKNPNARPHRAPPAMGWFRRLVGRSIPKDMALAAALSDRASWACGMLRLGLHPDTKLRADGSRLAHIACYAPPRESETLARALIQAGADLDALDVEGFTPLGIAIVKRRADIARLWISAGASVKAVSGGQAPLALALEDFPESVGLLLEHGASLEAVPMVDALIAACDNIALNESFLAGGGMVDGDLSRLLDSALAVIQAMRAAGIDALSSEGAAFLSHCSQRRRNHGPAHDKALMVIRASSSRAELEDLLAEAPRRPARSL